jgi:hypothetical protein
MRTAAVGLFGKSRGKLHQKQSCEFMKLTYIISIAMFALCRTPLMGADDPSSALSSILKPGKAYLVALPGGAIPNAFANLRASPTPFERRRVTIVESIGAGWYWVDYEVSTRGPGPDRPGKPEVHRALVNFAHVSSIEELDNQPAPQITK